MSASEYISFPRNRCLFSVAISLVCSACMFGPALSGWVPIFISYSPGSGGAVLHGDLLPMLDDTEMRFRLRKPDGSVVVLDRRRGGSDIFEVAWSEDSREVAAFSCSSYAPMVLVGFQWDRQQAIPVTRARELVSRQVTRRYFVDRVPPTDALAWLCSKEGASDFRRIVRTESGRAVLPPSGL